MSLEVYGDEGDTGCGKCDTSYEQGATDALDKASYLLWSLTKNSWWAPLGMYTPNVDEAQRFNRQFALSIMKAQNPKPGIPSDIITLERDAMEIWGKVVA